VDFNKEREMCLALKEAGRTRKEIAEITGLSERQVKRRLANKKKSDGLLIDGKSLFGTNIVVSGDTEGWSRTIKPFDQSPPFVDYEHHHKVLEEFTKQRTEKTDIPQIENPLLATNDQLFDYKRSDENRQAVQKRVEDRFVGREVKVLYLSDLHIPFTDYETVFRIVEQHSDANVCIVNGDLLDLFAVSKFSKNKHVALRKEIEDGRVFLEYLSKRFEVVVVTEGNHERRLRRFIEEEIPQEMQFLFPKDILRVIVSGEVLDKDRLDNVEVVGTWWVKLWDTIYAHPDNYNSPPMRTSISTSQYFIMSRGIQHRVCIIGHTHKVGEIMNGGVKIIESGCLCHDMDYHFGSKFTQQPWVKAYVVQRIGKDGLSDLNSTRAILL